MLRFEEIEMLTFENECSIVLTKIRVDGSILEKQCFTENELETYLCDLLTWDGLKLDLSTSIYIKINIDNRKSTESDVMLPAIWFLEESNVMWLCSYYKDTCISKKIALIASVIAKNLTKEETTAE